MQWGNDVSEEKVEVSSDDGDERMIPISLKHLNVFMRFMEFGLELMSVFDRNDTVSSAGGRDAARRHGLMPNIVVLEADVADLVAQTRESRPAEGEAEAAEAEKELEPA